MEVIQQNGLVDADKSWTSGMCSCAGRVRVYGEQRTHDEMQHMLISWANQETSGKNRETDWGLWCPWPWCRRWHPQKGAYLVMGCWVSIDSASKAGNASVDPSIPSSLAIKEMWTF